MRICLWLCSVLIGTSVLSGQPQTVDLCSLLKADPQADADEGAKSHRIPTGLFTGKGGRQP